MPLKQALNNRRTLNNKFFLQPEGRIESLCSILLTASSVHCRNESPDSHTEVPQGSFQFLLSYTAIASPCPPVQLNAISERQL